MTHEHLAILAVLILSDLPDATPVTVTMPLEILRRAAKEHRALPEWISTIRAAETFGRTSEYWRQRATEWSREDEEAGEPVKRAYREREGAPWNLRNEACRAHCARLAASKASARLDTTTTRKGGPRGPWKKGKRR